MLKSHCIVDFNQCFAGGGYWQYWSGSFNGPIDKNCKLGFGFLLYRSYSEKIYLSFQLQHKLGPPLTSRSTLCNGHRRGQRNVKGSHGSDSSSHLRARIAFLRIQTIRMYLVPTPGQQNRQWKRVDKLLQWLDSKGRLFCRKSVKSVASWM
jgi:hypothetical protein